MDSTVSLSIIFTTAIQLIFFTRMFPNHCGGKELPLRSFRRDWIMPSKKITGSFLHVQPFKDSWTGILNTGKGVKDR